MALTNNADALNTIFNTIYYAYNNHYIVNIYANADENNLDFTRDTEAMNNFLTFNSPSISFNEERLNLERDKHTKKFKVSSSGQPYQRQDTLTVTWRENDDWAVKKYHEEWVGLFYDRENDQYKSAAVNIGTSGSSSRQVSAENLYRTIRVTLIDKAKGDNTIVFKNVIPASVPGIGSLQWTAAPIIVQHSMSYYVEDWYWENTEVDR